MGLAESPKGGDGIPWSGRGILEPRPKLLPRAGIRVVGLLPLYSWGMRAGRWQDNMPLNNLAVARKWSRYDFERFQGYRDLHKSKPFLQLRLRIVKGVERIVVSMKTWSSQKRLEWTIITWWFHRQVAEKPLNVKIGLRSSFQKAVWEMVCKAAFAPLSPQYAS